MDSARLDDKVRWGLNRAARFTGAPTDAYRPKGANEPLAATNRFLRLHATFTSVHGNFERTNLYGNSLWHGVFDAAYTQVGDYLVQDKSIWFVASQYRLLPVLCVRAERIVTFSRPAAQSSSGASAYGGITAGNVTPLMADWPASITAAAAGGRPSANLPGDTTVPYWTVLLPCCVNVVLRPADLMSDDLGRNAVVTAAELTDLGWRISVKQATT